MAPARVRFRCMPMVHVSNDIAARREVADRMAEAARAWLDTLNPEQRAIGHGAVPTDDASDNERRRWFYTPTDHGGVTIHQQRPAQHRAAMRRLDRPLASGVRHRRDDHGPGERARLRRGLQGKLRTGPGRDRGCITVVFGEPGAEGLWVGGSAATTSR